MVRLKTSRRNASTTVYQSVKRTRKVSNMILPGRRTRFFSSGIVGANIFFLESEQVTCAAACMQQRRLGIRVNLAPQSVHIHFDQVREWIECFIPNMLGNCGAPHYLASVARKKFHQRVFLSS